MTDACEINNAASGNWRQQENVMGNNLSCDQDSITMFESKELPDWYRIEANNWATDLAALDLFDLGFNVIPLSKGTKKPIGRWSLLKTTRLPRKVVLTRCTSNNLGVITGRLSMNLFVIDCDDEDAFQSMFEELSKFGLAKWVVKSHRGGHFWFLSTDGEVGNKKHGDVEVWGNNHYIVAPPSVHPSGELYQWHERDGNLPPTIDGNTINTLIPWLGFHRRDGTGLPRVAEKVLLYGKISNYSTNSDAEFAAVLSMVGARMSDEDIISTFQQFTPPHYLKSSTPDEWLKRYMIERARVINNSAPENPILSKAFEWANSRPWKGRTGSTDRKVYLACLNRAKYESVDCFRATEREISEMAGIYRKTARLSLRRLCATDFLITVCVSRNKRGNHYAINQSVFGGP